MKPVVAIAAVALRRFFRDRGNYFFVFVFPLLLVVLLGLQFGEGADDGRIVVVGDSGLADQVATSLDADDVVVSRGEDVEDAQTVVARGRADAAVVVDAAAAAAFDAGDPAGIPVIVGSQAGGQATVQQVQTALDDIAGRATAVQALVAAGMDGPAAGAALDEVADAGPSLTVRTVGDSVAEEFGGLGQFDLGAAQQLSLFVFLISLTGAAFLIQSRELGATNRMLAAPVRPITVVLGEALGRFTIAITQGGYIILGTAVIFGVDWGDPVAAFVLLATYCAVCAAAAMVVGAALDNANLASGVGVGLGLVLAALGGSMIPLEFFPDGLLVVSRITPHHWAYLAWAELQRAGGSLVDILPELGVLAAMAVVLLWLGAVALRRSMQRAI